MVQAVSRLKNWFEDDATLQEMLYAELDDDRRELFNRVHHLPYGCSILHFLRNPPRELLSSEDIAFHLGEAEILIGPSVRALAELGLVRRVGVGESVFFGLGTDRQKQRLVQELFQRQWRWHTRLGRMENLLEGYWRVADPRRLSRKRAAFALARAKRSVSETPCSPRGGN